MSNNITLMIGGIQGEGIVSTGNILIKTLSRLGLYTYGFRNFASRIKGGHTNYIIEISSEKVLAKDDKIDILIASDMETVENNINILKDNGLLIHDSTIDPKDYFTKENFHILSFPFTDIAKKHGKAIMKNTALIGFLGKLLRIPMENIDEIIRETYNKKGKDTVLKNLLILEKSYSYPVDIENFSDKYGLKITSSKEARASMVGNEAVALGALMAGCRLMTAYPITPASEIMEYLSKKLYKYNGKLVQTEDEIAAVTMAIGGSYGGVRSMTATSGPGISLMMEGIGLAGMAEIPLVIVDSQRVGPSTGLPTKHEQSDIKILYNGSHGEIPLIIVTPYSVEECFYRTIDAFNLAEKYQCPVFILSDLTLGLSRQTIAPLDKNKIIIDRGKIVDVDKLSESTCDFRRFDFTTDNISPRSLPGMENGIHKVTGLEHSVIGVPNNNPENRKKMMDKRLNKLKEMELQDNIDLFGNLSSELLVLSIGSNYGIIKKAVEDFDLPVIYGMFKMIKPLPKKQLEYLFNKYSKILIVENNATKQLFSIIKQEFSNHEKLYSLTKYDGLPFKIREIKDKVEELI
ncbi:2-oxoacid:acceptor oxidoreductase subunit alpha [Maledivibacter halophilus]|uniref:2-oxoglutarate ferredoxin oxidoreductase subunit alpha n=1 Tax=Maledivibacter halophilus TaxID=36842 RepID=A0A1T5M5E6_9FIRM|nr:2-oxoacid:acceptor oxidoreductase subunit alpha [Maledivibacter halophilus]SKC83353.1 2-oxoglutarate ferredoxin oxidoreductase subunit alpha [Maledivibacter halophilus]